MATFALVPATHFGTPLERFVPLCGVPPKAVLAMRYSQLRMVGFFARLILRCAGAVVEKFLGGQRPPKASSPTSDSSSSGPGHPGPATEIGHPPHLSL